MITTSKTDEAMLDAVKAVIEAASPWSRSALQHCVRLMALRLAHPNVSSYDLDALCDGYDALPGSAPTFDPAEAAVQAVRGVRAALAYVAQHVKVDDFDAMDPAGAGTPKPQSPEARPLMDAEAVINAQRRIHDIVQAGNTAIKSRVRLIPGAGGRHVAVLDLDEAVTIKGTDGAKLLRLVEGLVDDVGESAEPGNTAACLTALSRLRGRFGAQLDRVEAGLEMQRRDSGCDATLGQICAVADAARDLLIETAVADRDQAVFINTGRGRVVSVTPDHGWLTHLLQDCVRESPIMAMSSLVTDCVVEPATDHHTRYVLTQALRSLAYRLAHPAHDGDFAGGHFVDYNPESDAQVDVAELARLALSGDSKRGVVAAIKYLLMFMPKGTSAALIDPPSPADLDAPDVRPGLPLDRICDAAIASDLHIPERRELMLAWVKGGPTLPILDDPESQLRSDVEHLAKHDNLMCWLENAAQLSRQSQFRVWAQQAGSVLIAAAQ